MPPLELDKETTFLISACLKQRGLTLDPPVSFPALQWDRVITLAQRHKVVGLLHGAAQVGLSDLPVHARLRLKREAGVKAAVQRLLLEEWGTLENDFRQHGLPVLMVKGPALACQLFGDPMAREFRDIDLLVPDHVFDRASALFLARGYSVDAIPRHRTFYRPGLPVHFELHAAPKRSIGLTPLQTETAWARSVILENGLSARTLSRPDHALLCLLHGSHHRWCQLSWVLDALAFPELEAVARTAPHAPGFPSADKTLAEFRKLAGALVHGRPLPARTARAFVAARPLDVLATGSELWAQSRLYGAWDRLAFAGKALASLLQPNYADRRLFQTWPATDFWAAWARPLLLLRRHWRRVRGAGP